MMEGMTMKDRPRDINEIRISGRVDSLKRISTKAGMPLTTFTVSCGKEMIHNVAFSPLAEQITIERGDRVEVQGRARSTGWIDQQGQQRFGWQVVCLLVVKLDDGQSSMTTRRNIGRASLAPQQGRLFPVGGRRESGDDHAYRGGIF